MQKYEINTSLFTIRFFANGDIIIECVMTDQSKKFRLPRHPRLVEKLLGRIESSRPGMTFKTLIKFFEDEDYIYECARTRLKNSMNGYEGIKNVSHLLVYDGILHEIFADITDTDDPIFKFGERLREDLISFQQANLEESLNARCNPL